MCSKRPVLRKKAGEKTSDIDEEPVEGDRDKVDMALDATKEIFRAVEVEEP
jgi:hypothetical protein